MTMKGILAIGLNLLAICAAIRIYFYLGGNVVAAAATYLPAALLTALLAKRH